MEVYGLEDKKGGKTIVGLYNIMAWSTLKTIQFEDPF